MRSAMFAGMLLLAAAAQAAEAPAPAASLLLPRFEVSLESGAFDTVFEVRNTSELPQILRVKFHTDIGFASMWYSTVLMPHDSTKVDLYVMLTTMHFPQRGLPASPVNPRHAAGAGRFCSEGTSKGELGILGTVVRYHLTSGCAVSSVSGCAGDVVGHRHPHAIGYAVIDVMPSCTTSDELPRLEEPVLTGTFEQRALGRVIASGPLVPMPLPSSVTLRVPGGPHDVVVWRGPSAKVQCQSPARDVFEIVHVDQKRAQTLTFRGDQVWAMITEPMPADPAAQPPPSGCPGVYGF